MATFKIHIINSWLERGPDGRPIPKYKESKDVIEISAVDTDAARIRARQIAQDKKVDIRSISHAVDGSLHVVVWRDGKPQVTPDKGIVWKRPPASVGQKL